MQGLALGPTTGLRVSSTDAGLVGRILPLAPAVIRLPPLSFSENGPSEIDKAPEGDPPAAICVPQVEVTVGRVTSPEGNG